MYYIRTTKTTSGATAVQVVQYVNRKIKVITHIGSAHNPDELQTLKQMAGTWIEQITNQPSLFVGTEQTTDSTVIVLDKCEYLGVRYTFIYEIFHKLLARFKFVSFGNKLLIDLIIMRLVEPVSKLRSLELLKEYFGISHRRQTFYEVLPELVKLKDSVERLVTKVARTEFGLDFSLVFYDVTTLYFESFTSDDLRKPGFSKDNKSNQPQIVIGLVVNSLGFPVAHEVFEGNKFEGHTIIPVIQAFQTKHKIKTLTVVADAAMISLDNVEALKEKQLSYIVGGRMGNLSKLKIKKISEQLKRIDRASIRTQTEHGTLICEFSIKRYRKDKHEMEKQLKKAAHYVKNPARMKRTKFLKSSGKNSCELNTELMGKTVSLLGIKGYYTNLGEEIGNQTIIDHYHNLWHVEQAFRIAKNDLQIRPIFHFKQDAIKTHILICFMALAISKYLEIKTGKSINQIIKSFKRVTDARIFDVLTKKEIVMRTKIPDEILNLLKKLDLPY